MRFLLCAAVALFIQYSLAVATNALGQPIVSPPVRIDPGNDDSRFAFEYVAVANGMEVVGLWMKWPAEDQSGNPLTIRRAVSTDGGTSWLVDDFQALGTMVREVDPIAAYDPGTDTFFVGSKRGTPLQFARRSPLDSPPFPEFTTSQRVDVAPGTLGSDRPIMGAGPLPGNPNTTRVYIAGKLGGDLDDPRTLMWSDDRGDTWNVPIDAALFNRFVVRVGESGRLYFSLGPNQTTGEIAIARSFSLSGGSPVFETPVVLASGIPPQQNPATPGDFAIHHFAATAIDPTDSRKVYVVYGAPNGQQGQNIDLDLFFTKTNDATVQGGGFSSPVAIPIQGDQFFPWLERDNHGRLHLICMDTRENPQQDDSQSNDDGLFDFYYAYSTDEGASWNWIRLTPTSFDVVDSRPVSPLEQFHGDYIGMAVSGNRVWPF